MADGKGKYGKVVIYDADGVEKVYPPGMPIFVTLGQDALAGVAPAAYSEALRSEGLIEAADDVQAFLLNMQAWQIEHPELVKMPD
jgi:hypothetical protein